MPLEQTPVPWQASVMHGLPVGMPVQLSTITVVVVVVVVLVVVGRVHIPEKHVPFDAPMAHAAPSANALPPKHTPDAHTPVL